MFPTVEHAYVMAKNPFAFSSDDIEWFITTPPGMAKRVGRNLSIPDTWESAKLDVMLELTRLKYSDDNPELKAKLIDTNDAIIIEENTWYDVFWGMTPDGIGENNLGKIIMQVRNELQQ